jgi:hypothetical protein
MNHSCILRAAFVISSAALAVGCAAGAQPSDDEEVESQAAALADDAFAIEEPAGGEGGGSSCSITCKFGSCSVTSPFPDRKATCTCEAGLPRCEY